MLDRYRKLIFLDLETTGPDPAVDAITEIGIVEVGAAGVERWSTLVNPQAPIPPFIERLTGISDAMVRDAPSFAELQPELLRRLRDGLLIAHNARFDYGFLRNAFARCGTVWRSETLCTVKLSRRLFPNELKHSLDALVARHGLRAETRHRALADADLLWQFWRRLETTLAADALTAAIDGVLQRPNLPPHLEPELLDELPDTPGVYLFHDEHDRLLYVGRAGQLRQRVLTHFGERPASKDAQLARRLHRISWHETAGEVGAQLLEARLLRELQPLCQDAGRGDRTPCSWQLQRMPSGEVRPVLRFASEPDFAEGGPLYGLFNAPDKAEAALRALADRHELCVAELGLEARPQAGKPCFAYQLRRCRGACVGVEPAAQHQARLEQALATLRLKPWPYDGPAAMTETGPGGRRDIHLVHNWRHLGSARDEQELRRLLQDAPAHPRFDVDAYRILTRALELGKLRAEPLASLQPASP